VALIKEKAFHVLFGKDMTIEGFTAEEMLLSGNPQTEQLIDDILTHFHQYEHGFADKQLMLILEGQFPFVDFYPWIRHNNAEGAVELVREYFARMMPRIIVTFSQLVSALTASNFVPPYGLARYALFYTMLTSQSRIFRYDNLNWMKAVSRRGESISFDFIQSRLS
jgi:hypothetical protein